MTKMPLCRCLVVALCCMLVAKQLAAEERASSFPKAGDSAPDFTLAELGGEKVELSRLLKQGPVVLIVLRGYPGYQCPACKLQVGQFLASAKKFADAGVSIVLVYPGEASGLKAHADEFVRGKTLPDNFFLVLDPDFAFTLSYRLRWQEKNETAYPATLVINPNGKIQFAKISTSHKGRASADEVLDVLKNK